MMKTLLQWKKTIFIAASAAFLTGCEGTTSSVSVGYGVYGGYGYPYYGGGYYGGYYPPYRPPHRPDRPRPEHPIHRPDRPTTKPATRPSRPSMGRPSGMSRPMSRPSGGMRRR